MGPRRGWGHVTFVLSFKETLTPPHHSRGTHEREKILAVSFKTKAEMNAFEEYAQAKAVEWGGVSLEQPLKDARDENSGLNLNGFTEVFMLSGHQYELILQLFREEAVRVAAEESKASSEDNVLSTTRERLKYFPPAAFIDGSTALMDGAASLAKSTRKKLTRRCGNKDFCKCFSGCLALFLMALTYDGKPDP